MNTESVSPRPAATGGSHELGDIKGSLAALGGHATLCCEVEVCARPAASCLLARHRGSCLVV